jgi:nucleoside-diphosphate-sugar epimerase
VKRVLVTGASGFVGRQTLAPLRALGFEVHAVSRHPGVADAIWHGADLLDAGAPARLCDRVRPTHLLHLAWYAEPGRYWTAPENLDWVSASTRLLRAFADAGGARVVTAGTCAEYDWSASSPFDERTTPTRPGSLYAACKHATALVQQSHAATAGYSQAWARLFFLYGPHEHPARLVSSVATAILRGGEAACSTGTQRRDFLHVADCGEALVRLLDSNVEGAINIGSGASTSVRQVIETVARDAGGLERVRFGARPAAAGEPMEIVAAVARLHREVGWLPKYSLDDGLASTVAWWRAHAGVTK